MANSINGTTVIATDADRIFTAMHTNMFKKVYKNEVLRARVTIDTDATFVIDDPHLITAGSNDIIAVVGMRFSVKTAMTIQLQSKVDSGTATDLEKYELAAGGGVGYPTRSWVVASTALGGKLQIVTTSASGTNILKAVFDYVIASNSTLA